MFDFDSYNLTSGTQEILTALANTLNKYDDTDILIEGHTDKTDTDSYNLMLSQERSEDIKIFLKHNNVDGGRITTKGY